MTQTSNTFAGLPARALTDLGGISVAVLGIIAGFVLTEYVPHRDDAHRLSALTAARIVAVAMGLIGGPAT